jgi:hypothetical protein
VRRERPVAVRWKLLCLELVNKEPEDGTGPHAPARVALRTLVLARREGGDEAMDRLYVALGRAVHEERQRLGDRAVLDAAVLAAGLPADLPQRALVDPSTWEEIVAEETEAVERLNAFGVPTLSIDGSLPGTFGPVINRVPEGAEAVELWDHFAWLARNQTFFEIKKTRPRRRPPAEAPAPS